IISDDDDSRVRHVSLCPTGEQKIQPPVGVAARFVGQLFVRPQVLGRYLGAGVSPLSSETANAFPFSARPRETSAMLYRDFAPQHLREQCGPEASSRGMAGGDVDLVARDPAHSFGMPAAETCAADVYGARLRNISPANAERGAPQSEIRILQITF